MIKHMISVIGFMLVTFGVQGMSHFVINKGHFSSIEFMRNEPIIQLGLLVMVIQGLIMSLALERYKQTDVSIRDGLLVSMAFGVFLGAYIAIVEPSKYAVPSIRAWMMIEGLASVIQFSLFGVLLGFIHQSQRRRA